MARFRAWAWAASAFLLATGASAGPADEGARSAPAYEVSVSATLAETVSITVTTEGQRIGLDSHGSNVNVVATLQGTGHARPSGAPGWAPQTLEAQWVGVDVPAAGLVWATGEPSGLSDSSLVLALACGPADPSVLLPVELRSDGREVAVLGPDGWDRAKIPDGRLGDEPADRDQATDVRVSLCGAAFSPTGLAPGHAPVARFAFAVLLPWAADGHSATLEWTGSPPTVESRSWGPHDFLPGTPDDPA